MACPVLTRKCQELEQKLIFNDHGDSSSIFKLGPICEQPKVYNKANRVL